MKTRQKTSLADAMRPVTPPQSTSPVPQKTTSIAPSRAGKKSITAFIEKEAFRQFKFMSVEQEKTQERLLIEALNDLFQKYGKPRIA